MSTGPTLSSIIWLMIDYLNQALFLIMGVAVIMFVFYVIKYFMRPTTDRAEAGTYVMYSIIGFFIVLSFWGIVNIVQNTFGLSNEYFQPSSWTSFSSLFPGGNTGGWNNSGTNGGQTYGNSWNFNVRIGGK